MDWVKGFAMNVRYIVGGLILGHIPQELEQTSLIANLEPGKFFTGFAAGVFLAVRIIGVCVFAYGIAYYAQKIKPDNR